MAIDPRFICSSDLEGIFLDKLTGLPLAAGVIKFYSDPSFSVPKVVYKLSGSPPYTTSSFVSLGSTLTLNSIGGYQDGLGNSIVIYYYPFSEDPFTHSTSVLQELYYITVENSGGTQQFTRMGWPPLASNFAQIVDSFTDDVTNLFSNGQFLAYNTPIPQDTISPNLISTFAPGGWSFRQSSGSTGVYTLTVESVISGTSNLVDFPQKAIRVSRGVKGNETVYEIVFQWADANLLSRIPAGASNFFNLCFAAQANDLLTSTVNVYEVCNFGGGGGNEYFFMGQAIISSAADYNYYNVTLTPVDNTVHPIGGPNSLGIAIQMPGTPFDISFTDFSLTITNTPMTAYPFTSTHQMMADTFAGNIPLPNPDGSQLYLPLVLTPQGMTWDTSIIGQITGKTQLTASVNELLMDGSTYIRTGYSSSHIPYKRLSDYLVANQALITIGTSTIPAGTTPMYGTGPNFVTILKNTDPTKFDLSFNTSSGSNTTANATSGFTHTSADPLYVYTVTGVPAAGTYFTFSPNTGGNLVYNVWFSVNSGGIAPVTPTGANIQVSLVTGDTVASTITKILTAVNQYQFMVLNAQGYFWRGLDAGATIDPNAATRTIPGIKDNSVAAAGAYLGSLQASGFKDHTHDPLPVGQQYAYTGGTGSNGAAGVTSQVGGTTGNVTSPNGGLTETRPVNYALNWFIKY